MDEMNDKISSILNDPKMMQQIMSMAQTLGASSPGPEPPKQERSPEPKPPRQDFPGGFDINAIQQISRFAQQGNIDKREQALLRALGAYLSKDRISRLEKAMRAAKLAKIASAAITSTGR